MKNNKYLAIYTKRNWLGFREYYRVIVNNGNQNIITAMNDLEQELGGTIIQFSKLR